MKKRLRKMIKCSVVGCSFLCETYKDLEWHMQYHENVRREKVEEERTNMRRGWTSTKNRDVQKIRRVEAPSVAKRVETNGEFVDGGFKYWLAPNIPQYVFRRKVGLPRY